MVPTITYYPVFFSDAPHIVHIPAGVPDPIVEELNTSFKLYWVSREACANSIRSVVERILTHFGVRQSTISTKRKRVRITTHDRIELYRPKNSDVANRLMALKWIGNTGSHAKPITKDDLLDGFELLDDVLDRLFGGRAKRAARLSQQINKRRGPRSAKRSHPAKQSLS